MSVSKWAYEPEKCDGKPCVGDCDYCDIKYGVIAHSKPLVYNYRTAEDEIARLKAEVQAFKDRYDELAQVIDTQQETINTYSKIFMLQEAELEKLRNEDV